ncbi:hypothetical protein D917_08620 [Trichinella nativa]|uniref:Uncharacterized protein n=1 Tax=Trichinella nativa TaxID=6335 RepID=A0A1Y3EQ08_9BILA|nr:hypothetical protein D917_08620 [Trichinella nativa]
MTLILTVTLALLALISRFALSIWMAKRSSFRYGILLDRSVSERSPRAITVVRMGSLSFMIFLIRSLSTTLSNGYWKLSVTLVKMSTSCW